MTTNSHLLYGVPIADPTKHGMNADRLAVFDRFFVGKVENKTLQGVSYLISKGGTIVAANTMGRRTCREGSDELTLDAIGDMFELTVVFTATSVMQLIDASKLSLHQRVAEFVPEFNNPYHEDITIYHLLTNTSGLDAMPGILGEPYQRPNFNWHPTFKGNWLATLLSIPLLNTPGEQHVWGIAAYAVLGAVVEKITGKRIEAYIEQHILKPLGMQDSFFTIPADKKGRMVYCHEWQEWGINNGNDSRVPLSHSGLYSSLHDLHKFGRMLLGCGELDGVRILSRRSAELMTTDRMQGVTELTSGNVNDNFAFGLGWRMTNGQGEPLNPGTYWQGNSICGLYIDPKEELIYTFFTPNSTWNFEDTNTRPRVLLWSAIEPSSPERHSVNAPIKETADRLDVHLRGLSDQRMLQGASYLLAEGSEVVAKGAAGRRLYNNDSMPLVEDSVFLVSSLTKLITVVAVMQLVEDAKLILQQPVKDFIPEFDTNMHRGICVSHLMDHTSGLSPEPGLLGEPNPNGWWEYRFMFDGSWIKAVLAGPLRGGLGKTKLYSTAGYLILGEVIARVSGIPYEQYVQEHILKPLGMNATYFSVPENVYDHVAVADEWQSLLLCANRSTNSEPPRSGTGMYSALDDLHKLGLMLIDGGRGIDGQLILGKASVDFLKRKRFMGVPGLLWTGMNEASFPYEAGQYPAIQLGFPMPYHHDLGISGALILDPASRFVAALLLPSTTDWTPEPLVQAKNIIISGMS